MSDVVWHDIECGSYVEDLPLWRALAQAEPGPILDIGAGTGRVALDLAAQGHHVTALDSDVNLLAALTTRARLLPIEAIVADARSFALAGRTFGLILAPMQIVQLLRPAGRVEFLRTARAHLSPGGLLACALADAMEAFDDEHCIPPAPDRAIVDGVYYSSQTVALRDNGDHVTIERIRETLDAAGRRTAAGDKLDLDRLDGPTLEAEGRAAGLTPEPARTIDPTDEHVGSTVVMLRG